MALCPRGSPSLARQAQTFHRLPCSPRPCNGSTDFHSVIPAAKTPLRELSLSPALRSPACKINRMMRISSPLIKPSAENENNRPKTPHLRKEPISPLKISSVPTGSPPQISKRGAKCAFRFSSYVPPIPDGVKYDRYGFRTDIQKKGLPLDVQQILSGRLSDHVTIVRSIEEEMSHEIGWRNMLATEGIAFPLTEPMILTDVPFSMRRRVWSHYLCHFAQSCQLSTFSISATLCQDSHQILLDIERTFPQHMMFAPPSTEGRESLFQILNCFCLNHPSISYCQGMSYVAAVLLIATESPSKAYQLFHWMVIESELSSFYKPTMEGMLDAATKFTELLSIQIPELHAHFAKHMVDALLYATQWFLSMFTTLRDWEATLFAFDLFFHEKITAIYRLSFALLHACKDDLLQLDSIDTILPYLQNIPPARSHPSILIPVLSTIQIDKTILLKR